MDRDKRTNFSRWLEILQQESWQLELLISGFAIFLLAESYIPVRNLIHQIELLATGSNYYQILFIPYQVLMGAWYVLMVNLIMHVLLRGLWISTIGLRYISGDIELDELNLSPKFDRFLRKRVKKFDLYIQQLERLCSTAFGFTFLIIFILISLGLYITGIFGIVWTMEGFSAAFGGSWFLIFVPFLLIYLLGGLIYFIDFISLGRLKKHGFFGKIYYPFYRFFGFVTLSFIYRPIYYNLVDNKFGRKVILFMIPYLALFSIFSSLNVETESYLPDRRFNESINTYIYDDTWNGHFTNYSASIPSKYTDNGFVELYLPYIPRSDDPVIEHLCPDLVPAKRGVFLFGINNRERYMMDAAEALACHSKRFKIYANDSLHNGLKYRFYDHPTRDNVGLLTILDLSYLPRGEHELNVVVLLFDDMVQDSLYFRETVKIPFWKQ